MELAEFIEQVAGFDTLPPNEKICLFAWFLHTHRGIEIVGNEHIRRCFRDIDIPSVDTSVYLPRLAAKKPPVLIRKGQGYCLEGAVRRRLDVRYGGNRTRIMISQILADLPNRLPNLNEKVFLQETISCYQISAFRAAIVMAWNLAFGHLIRWILTDPVRLSKFNASLALLYPKKKFDPIASLDSFENVKEFEVIEACRAADLVSKNVIEILREKLKKRNIAAHPSQAVITQHQADDVISDLVNNVVLLLKQSA